MHKSAPCCKESRMNRRALPGSRCATLSGLPRMHGARVRTTDGAGRVRPRLYSRRACPSPLESGAPHARTRKVLSKMGWLLPGTTQAGDSHQLPSLPYSMPCGIAQARARHRDCDGISQERCRDLGFTLDQVRDLLRLSPRKRLDEGRAALCLGHVGGQCCHRHITRLYRLHHLGNRENFPI